MKLEKIVELDAQQRIWTVDWHPNMELLATAGESRSVKLWRAHPQKQWVLQEQIPTEHTKSIRRIKFNHNGKSLAIASFDSVISIFIKGQEGYQQLAWLEGHQNEVKGVDWSPNDLKISSCSRDKNVWIWVFNASTFDYQCQTVLQGHTEDVKSVIWLENDCIASCSYDATIRLWAEEDGQFEPFQVLQGHTSTVWGLAYNNLSNCLYSCGQDLKLMVWQKDQSSQRFELKQTIENTHLFPIYCLSIVTPQIIVSCGGDNTVAIVNKGQVQDRGVHRGQVNSVSFKKGLLASGGDDQKVIIWKVLGL